MAGALTRIRSQVADGFARLKSGTGATTYGDYGWRPIGGFWERNLPGTRFNFKREAGTLWDNSVVRMGLKWIEDTYPEARQVVRRPGQNGKLEIVATPHPLLALLAKPNPLYSARLLNAGLLISLKTDGNAYLLKVRSGAGKVVGIVYLPHMLVEPVAGGPDGWIDHYRYQVGGQTTDFPVSEIVHIRDGCDPDNIRKGLARLGAALREVCTVNERSTFEATLLKNRGVPAAIINLKEAPNAGTGAGDAFRKGGFAVDQAKAIKKRWQEEFTGDNRFNVLVSSLPIDVHDIAFSPNDMALDKLSRLPISILCGSLNLDPMVLGLPSDEKKFANFREARAAAYEECLMPTQRLIDEELTAQLMPEIVGAQPSDVLGRDYSEVRALQEDQDALHRRWRDDYRAGGIKRKVFLARIGEEYDEVADDVYFTDLVSPTAVPAPDMNKGRVSEFRRHLSAKFREELRLERAHANGNTGQLAQISRGE